MMTQRLWRYTVRILTISLGVGIGLSCTMMPATAQFAPIHPHAWQLLQHSNSVYQNNLRAQALFLETQAEVNIRMAVAEIQWQEANRLYYQNEKLRVQTYWDMQHAIHENRERLHGGKRR